MDNGFAETDVDGRCDARVSCGDETSEVRGTRSECRGRGSSRAVAVTDVGRVRVCASPALADGVAIAESAKCALPIFLRPIAERRNLVAERLRPTIGADLLFRAKTPLVRQTV